MNASSEQPKRTLEDFKKLGATLHQKLVLARVAPALLKLQPEPEPEGFVAKEDEEFDEEQAEAFNRAISATASSFFAKKKATSK